MPNKERLFNKWFIIYLVIMIVSVIIFRFVPYEAIKALSLFGFAFAQVIYNLNIKIDKKLKNFSNFINWAYFTLFLIFAVIFLSTLTGEFVIGVISIYFFILAVIIGAIFINGYNLWKSQNIFGIVFSYLGLAFTFIIIFGMIFNFMVINSDSNKILTPNGNTILKSTGDFFYFSGFAFYSNISGEVYGTSRLLVVIELVLSFIIHGVIIAFVINSLPPRNKD